MEGKNQMKVTIVIPNYNGMAYLENCLTALRLDLREEPAHIIVVDNGSADGSREWITENCPEAELIALPENKGFPAAVNLGIRRAQTPYVILLNNDTEVRPGFTRALVAAIEADSRLFSVSAKMLDMKNENLVDSAGDLYCALGWAFARGKGRPAAAYGKPVRVFSACAGAAIYRRALFEQFGFFDELHFAYLEDVDIGWRARIYGYRSAYEPAAEVLHAGSASSGSRYNEFKARLSSSNSVYIIWKNMPLLQWLFNLPLLFFGFLIKYLFYVKKGMGGTYRKGCLAGLRRCFTEEGKAHKVRFSFAHLGNYICIQGMLWINFIRRL